MSKRFVPKIVSANDLLMGDVVYLAANGDWTHDLARAVIAEDDATAEALLARATAQEDRVVDPYLADVVLEPGSTLCLLHYREVLRNRGPSNRPDLGRQAER